MARLVPLLAACLLASGCFVFDELDKGQAILDKHSSRKAATAAEKAKTAEAAPTAGAGWWSKARSLDDRPTDSGSAGDLDAPVRCKVSGSTRFMRRGDCLSQGGSPTS